MIFFPEARGQFSEQRTGNTDEQERESSNLMFFIPQSADIEGVANRAYHSRCRFCLSPSLLLHERGACAAAFCPADSSRIYQRAENARQRATNAVCPRIFVDSGSVQLLLVAKPPQFPYTRESSGSAMYKSADGEESIWSILRS